MVEIKQWLKKKCKCWFCYRNSISFMRNQIANQELFNDSFALYLRRHKKKWQTNICKNERVCSKVHIETGDYEIPACKLMFLFRVPFDIWERDRDNAFRMSKWDDESKYNKYLLITRYFSTNYSKLSTYSSWIDAADDKIKNISCTIGEQKFTNHHFVHTEQIKRHIIQFEWDMEKKK